MRVDVSYTAPSGPPGNRVCLVIDVLRATSVMSVLLARGVQAIYPAASIEEGRRRLGEVAARVGRGAVVLCGEEHALPPEGYDYGNSPVEFERLDLPPHAVVATTNGTPALLACREAPLVVPAAPLNASAALARARATGLDVLVVCAGLRGAYAEDDTLAAGLFVERLVDASYEPGVEASDALALYRAADGDLGAAFRRTEHGARLVELGFEADLDFCATVDRYAAVGALALEDGLPVIRPLSAAE